MSDIRIYKITGKGRDEVDYTNRDLLEGGSGGQVSIFDFYLRVHALLCFFS